MARQASIFKMVGTIDDATFFNTADGFLVRKNNPISANRIKTDPAFELTRQNMAEFSVAGKSGKLIRNAFNSIVRKAGDKKVTSRLVKKIREIMQIDELNDRGERNLNDSNVKSMGKFEFNASAPLDMVFSGIYASTIERTQGLVTIDIAPFVPRVAVVLPSGATHYKFVAAAALVDFPNEERTSSYAESDMLTMDNQLFTPDPLTMTLKANSALPVFVVLGIEFYQKVISNYHQHDSGSYNTAKIIAVDVKS